jgi:beta-phosphoglucomutase-like phosphatase (HAD superfamily)
MALNILKTPGTVQGVLFDMDGVVIDSEKLYTRFWMEAAADLGHPMTREQALQMRSLNPGLAKSKIESFFGEDADYAAIRARRIELMNAHIEAHGVDEKPGIRALLVLLKEKNIPCAITSSTAIPVIRQHLGRLGLLEGFTVLCSGKDVPRGKPAPDIYLAGAAALGLWENPKFVTYYPLMILAYYVLAGIYDMFLWLLRRQFETRWDAKLRKHFR